MMIKSAPHPVRTPRTAVASRQPCAVVSNSGTAWRCGDSRVAKSGWYQSPGDNAPAVAGSTRPQLSDFVCEVVHT